MPLTPLHFLAIAPLYFKLKGRFDITALLLSSTCVDLEQVYRLFTGQPIAHGLWHSYFSVLTIYPVALALIVYVAERKFEKQIFNVYNFFGIYPTKMRYSFKTVYLCCLLGGVSHIFLDMWVHEHSPYVLFPFYEGNPFWTGWWSPWVFVLISLLSLYGIFLWVKQR